MKSLFLRKKSDNSYVEKYMLEKVGKHNLNIACMLIFNLENQNTTLKI